MGGGTFRAGSVASLGARRGRPQLEGFDVFLQAHFGEVKALKAGLRLLSKALPARRKRRRVGSVPVIERPATVHTSAMQFLPLELGQKAWKYAARFSQSHAT